MKKNRYFFIVILSIAGGILGAYLFSLFPVSEKERIADFYATETSVMISPHSLRKKIMEGKKDFVLVDVRSEQEYEKEHIIGAVNIPAYKDPDTSAYEEVDRIVNAFRELTLKNPEAEIIVYCYSIPCMTGRKVGDMLAKNDLYVKELGIGWNEWRYEWTMWNHEHEWEKTKVEDYIASGKEPGAYQRKEGDSIPPCTVNDELGC